MSKSDGTDGEPIEITAAAAIRGALAVHAAPPGFLDDALDQFAEVPEEILDHIGREAVADLEAGSDSCTRLDSAMKDTGALAAATLDQLRAEAEGRGDDVL